MYKIGIGSMFRDSVKWYGHNINQVERYAAQVLNQTFPFEDTAFCLLEGDSTDDTATQLYEFARGNNNVAVMHQNAQFDSVSSIEDEKRICSMAALGNSVLQTIHPQCEYVIWLESDLIIKDDLFEKLLTSIKETGAAMLAPLPLINLRGNTRMYDLWAFRELNGAPYKTEIKQKEVSSVGTCAIIRADCLRTCNFGEGAFPELCRQVRAAGGTVWVDGAIDLYHPGEACVHGRWI